MARAAYFLITYVVYACLAPDPATIVFTLAPFLLVLIFVATIRSRHVTHEDMLHLVCFLFFVISPLQSYNEGYFYNGPVGQLFIPAETLLNAFGIFCLFYTTFTLVLRSLLSQAPRDVVLVSAETPSLALSFGLLSLAAFLLYVASTGIDNLFATRYAKNLEDINPLSTLWAAVQIVSAFAIVSSARSRSVGSGGALLAVTALFALAVAQSPFNTSRNFILAAWLPIVIPFLPRRIGVASFYLFFVAAIFFVMPVVNLTSREGYTLSESIAAFDIQKSLSDPFSDVFPMLCYSLQWLEMHSFALGAKTLGLLLFFIPRSIWTSKPTLMGLDVGNDLYQNGLAGTANLSFFIGGDYYADAGYVGVLLGGVLTAVIVYLAVFRRRVLINGHDIKLYVYFAGLPILIRGPVAATVGLLFFEILFIGFACLVAGRQHPPAGSSGVHAIAAADPRAMRPAERLRRGPACGGAYE